MASISLKNISKKYGDFTAVKSMDLDIEDGSFVAILGPSGCGKSTTMNMIAGLEKPTRGQIRFDDREVTGQPIERRGVGFVFQNYAIFTHLSVRDNLAFGLKIGGSPPDEIKRRVKEMARFMEIDHRLDEPSSSLSVNELQKLAIGRSAIVEPRIFLLDEPLSNLDAAFRERMRTDLRHIQRRLGQTMVYVTHDQLEAMALADHIAVMSQGEVQQFDTPDNIYNRPVNTYVADFIGAPSMNILEGRLGSRAGEVHIGWQPWTTLRLPPALGAAATIIAEARSVQGVLVGFRPERILPGEHPDGSVIDARVKTVETLGAKQVVHLEKGDLSFKILLGREVKVAEGAQMQVTVPEDAIYLFERSSGKAIYAEGGKP